MSEENVHALYAPDPEAMTAHLEHLFGGFLDGFQDGLIELAWTDTTAKDGRYPLRHARLFGTDDIEGMVTEAVRLNSTPMCNVYVGAALRHPDTPPFARTTDHDFLALTCGYADLDDDGVAATAKDRFTDAKPTMVVVTGTEPYTRAQMWWRLDEPISDPGLSEGLLRGVAKVLRGDPSVVNPGRVMRLAGSIAWPMKPDRKRPEVTYIRPLRAPGQPVYAYGHLARAFPPVYGGDTNAGSDFDTPARAAATIVEDDGLVRRVTDLGLPGAVHDHRERHMRDTVAAVLIQLIGETGKVPTPQELFAAGWDQYARSTDLTKPGRGKDEYVAKCAYTVRRFTAGKIRGCRTIAEAQAVYRRKQQARVGLEQIRQQGHDPMAGLGDTSPTDITDDFPDAPLPAPLITVRPAFPIDRAAIPPRDWVIPGLLLKKNLSVLVAPPGSGKSLLTIQIGLATAVGLEWGRWKPRKPEKVLIINAEDDPDEMNRRMFVAAEAMGIDQADLAGQVVLPDAMDNIVIARMDGRTRSIVRMPLADALVALIRALGVGVMVVDPFAETFEGDENSNSEVKWAGMLWREVARKTGIALLLVHHTRKYAGGMAGDADASRGGGALIGTARILGTLFAMTEDEAKAMGVPPELRGDYVRYDDAKANHSKKGLVRWFEKQSVDLKNGTAFLPPDDVGVLVPWKPPGLFDAISVQDICTALDAIDRGVPDDDGRPSGQFYTTSDTSANKGRWAGAVLMRLLGADEDAAKGMLKVWTAEGVLEVFEYTDPVQRKLRQGVRSVAAKRPGRMAEDV